MGEDCEVECRSSVLQPEARGGTGNGDERRDLQTE